MDDEQRVQAHADTALKQDKRGFNEGGAEERGGRLPQSAETTSRSVPSPTS